MKQRCPLALVWLSWAVLVGGLAFLLIVGEYVLAGVWLVAAPLFQWAYVRTFPKTSRLLGYGSVADRPADRAGARRLVGHATSEELADFLRGPVLEAVAGPAP